MKSLNVIDLFSGCGGFSYGFHKNKFNILEAYDFWYDATRTYKNNYPNTNVLNLDISRICFKPLRDKVHVLIGGPPCQPFSIVGKQKGNKDSRDMIPEYIRIVEELNPKIFILENVLGLATKKNESYLNQKLNELRALGYILNFDVLDFRNWGVPQKRKRFILIGSKDQLIPFPKPSASQFVTLKEVFANHNYSGSNNTKIVFASNPKVGHSLSGSLLVNGKGRPLDMDSQSNTITASGGNAVHFWDHDKYFQDYFNSLKAGGKIKAGECNIEKIRRLTFEELKMIQTFPEDFKFFGADSSKIKQIGNSVPPKFSFELAKHIKQFL